MRTRTLAGMAVSLVAVAACVALAGWQWRRYESKQRLNAAMRAALASAPEVLRDASQPLAALRGHRVLVEGVYDETRHVLLDGRWHEDDPGVEVLTPLRLADGSAIMVDRGWLPSPDAMSARPEEHAEPGHRRVPGIAESLPRAARPQPWERLPGTGAERWSVRRLGLDSLAAHLPYPVAPYVLRALPDSAAPAQPAREWPAPLETSMHLSYAIQWCAIALIIAIGSSVLAWREFHPRA